jgi:hypothetical protein
MKHDALAAAAALSDADLVARLQHLAARARNDTVEMVAHLSELDARGLHLAEGYGSLFVYCTTALRLSEHEAYNRVVAARLARAFPSILHGLGDGAVNLTTLRLLAPLINADNHDDLLARAAGRSKREVEALVASLAPQPDVVPRIQRLTTRSRSAEESASANDAETLPHSMETRPALASAPFSTPMIEVEHPRSDPAPVEVPQANGDDARRAMTAPVHPAPVGLTVLAPLSSSRYRLQCTIGEGAHTDLRLAQDLLRREIPNGDPGAIIERALALLVAQIAKEKTAATSMPGPARSATPGARHIPASVKRAVWLRDRGQCAFVAKAGRRCAERAFLELHHIHPFALGGEGTVSNISLRCRRHNTYEAQMDFSPRALGTTERAFAPGAVR